MCPYTPVSKSTLEITWGSLINQNQKDLFGCLLLEWQEFKTALFLLSLPTSLQPTTSVMYGAIASPFAFGSALPGQHRFFFFYTHVAIVIIILEFTSCMSSWSFTMLQSIFLRNTQEPQLSLSNLIQYHTWPFTTHCIIYLITILGGNTSFLP